MGTGSPSPFVWGAQTSPCSLSPDGAKGEREGGGPTVATAVRGRARDAPGPQERTGGTFQKCFPASALSAIFLRERLNASRQFRVSAACNESHGLDTKILH